MSERQYEKDGLCAGAALENVTTAYLKNWHFCLFKFTRIGLMAVERGLHVTLNILGHAQQRQGGPARYQGDRRSYPGYCLIEGSNQRDAVRYSVNPSYRKLHFRCQLWSRRPPLGTLPCTFTDSGAAIW